MNVMTSPREAEVASKAGVHVMPEALAAVFRGLEQADVSYCYWKSSRRLGAVLAGDGDVDLLIDRAHQHKARSVLLEHGFKEFLSVPAHEHPALSTYLGYDDASGQLIHLHLHFQIVVGEPLLLNYQLPWRDTFLRRAIRDRNFGVYTLDPACEALLVIIRRCLELSIFDPISRRQWRAKAERFEEDRKTLRDRLDRDDMFALASELLGSDTASYLTEAFFAAGPLEAQSGLRDKVNAACRDYRTYNDIEARLRTAWHSVGWVTGNINKRLHLAPRPWNRLTPGGGRVIAIIGLDGSGKSTLRKAVIGWLDKKIDVLPVYFGTGDGRPSLVLWPLKLLQPLARLVIREKPRVASHGKASGRPPGLLYSVLLTCWAFAVALDKRQKLAAAQRGAARGLLILSDRYPQNQIRRYNDGPLLHRLEKAPQWLRRFELQTYERAYRPSPDLVIKLLASSETLAKREPTMDIAVIEERNVSIRKLEFPGARIVSVDAEQPLEAVIRDAKRAVWSVL